MPCETEPAVFVVCSNVCAALLLSSNLQAPFQLIIHDSDTSIGKLAISILKNKKAKDSIFQLLQNDFFFALVQKEFKKRLAGWKIEKDCECAMQHKIDESIFISCLITEIASGFQFCIYSYTDTSNVHKVIIHFDDVKFEKGISSSLFICEILLSLSNCSCMCGCVWWFVSKYSFHLLRSPHFSEQRVYNKRVLEMRKYTYVEKILSSLRWHISMLPLTPHMVSHS